MRFTKDAGRLVDPLYTFIARGYNADLPETFLAAADHVAAENGGKP